MSDANPNKLSLISRYEMKAIDWENSVAEAMTKKPVPWLRFPTDWEVQIIFPDTGAVIRFLVRQGNRRVSVYGDYFDCLGAFGAPYWEVYPYKQDVGRCPISDSRELLRMIRDSLDGVDGSRKDWAPPPRHRTRDE